MGSRIPGFYKMSIPERIGALRDSGVLSGVDAESLQAGRDRLDLRRADLMVENVVGVLGLPLGVAPNFEVNGTEYTVPLAVEEPSIVAGLSSVAKLVRSCGGFVAHSEESLLLGQVQVTGLERAGDARARLLERASELIDLANSLHPNLVARGGGARDVDVVIHSSPGGSEMLVVHLFVDTCEAMGANLVNTMCEGIAPLVEQIAGGDVVLRILSNLTDRAVVTAEAVVPAGMLATSRSSGEEIAGRIVQAGDLAIVDPYRATTHNKGIMNGVDALALATGNDWRALEAGAHAYAARHGTYTSLTRWRTNAAGDLVGTIELPVKVGTVGGSLQSNPTVALCHRLLGNPSARELAELMAAVGLAQNFAALRALASEGIQRGHMTLHARSVVTAAGAPATDVNAVVEKMVAHGPIKMWRAKEIIDEMGRPAPEMRENGPEEAAEAAGEPDVPDADWAEGHGKAILLGEHAVVYGRHAIAVPVPLTIRARAEDALDYPEILIPDWGVHERLRPQAPAEDRTGQLLRLVMDRLDISERPVRIRVRPGVPRAVGLGSSAALAVAVIRALDRHFGLGLDDDRVSALAFEGEKIAHGTPSGIDNSVAAHGRALVYCTADEPTMRPLPLAHPLPIVIALTGTSSRTADTVAHVRTLAERHGPVYKRVFDQIDALTLDAVTAIQAGDLETLGELMNVCQGQLDSLGVSTPDITKLVDVARSHGALGAKLTGGGGGGAVMALCRTQEEATSLSDEMAAAGYQTLGA